MRVYPKARTTTVGGRYGSGEPPVLVVRVAAPASDGRANEAVARALACAFDRPSSTVRIITGHTQRTKIVEVDDGDPIRLRQLLDKDD
ncbi:MAG TPA: DUF167 domain-containing protein [Mycobacteriales bacterium]|nr:DUF167 domain-containing protein [Mycobacteriales bacterium]HWC35490.1 DUF167 domain-containing protein [Mycobacteriales bacterium]